MASTATLPAIGSREDVRRGAAAVTALRAEQAADGFHFESSYRGVSTYGNGRGGRRYFRYDRADARFVRITLTDALRIESQA